MPIQFDIDAMHLIQSFSSPLMDEAMGYLSMAGSPLFWLLIAAVIYWKGRENDSFHLVNVVVFSMLVVGAAKEFFHRPRPSIEQGFRVLTSHYSFSFPSGHTTTIASVLGYYLKGAGKFYITVLALATLGVSYTRIYLGAHFPTDVIIGIFLGAGIGLLNYEAYRRFERSKFRLSKIGDELLLIVVVLGSIVVLLFFERVIEATAFLGYYAGFFWLKEREHHATILSGGKFYLKTTAGIAVASALMWAAVFLPLETWLRYVLFFFCGLWISGLWPLLYEKIQGQFSKA